MQLYYHPRSPYSHKVMIALAEKRAAYEAVMIRPDDEMFAKLTPIKKVPLLVLADGWKIPESTIIVEYLFALPGMGSLVIGAASKGDFVMVQGAVLVIAVIYVVVNAVIDISYGYLDPRIRRAHV